MVERLRSDSETTDPPARALRQRAGTRQAPSPGKINYFVGGGGRPEKYRGTSLRKGSRARGLAERRQELIA
jgi:hypothetical protein